MRIALTDAVSMDEFEDLCDEPRLLVEMAEEPIIFGPFLVCPILFGPSNH